MKYEKEIRLIQGFVTISEVASICTQILRLRKNTFAKFGTFFTFFTSKALPYHLV